MQLNAAASTALVIFYVILSLLLVAILGILAVALFRLQAKLEELTAQVEPLLQKTDGLLTVASEKVTTVGESAEKILGRGEETAADVQARVEYTGATVQRTVHAPVIGLNSLIAGVSEGVSTFSKLQARRGEGGTTDEPAAEAVSGLAAAEEPEARVRYGSGLAYRRGAAARATSGTGAAAAPAARSQSDHDLMAGLPPTPAETPAAGAADPSLDESATVVPTRATVAPGVEGESETLTVTGRAR